MIQRDLWKKPSGDSEEVRDTEPRRPCMREALTSRSATRVNSPRCDRWAPRSTTPESRTEQARQSTHGKNGRSGGREAAAKEAVWTWQRVWAVRGWGERATVETGRFPGGPPATAQLAARVRSRAAGGGTVPPPHPGAPRLPNRTRRTSRLHRERRNIAKRVPHPIHTLSEMVWILNKTCTMDEPQR